MESQEPLREWRNGQETFIDIDGCCVLLLAWCVMSYWCVNGVIHLFVHCVFIVHLVSCANGVVDKMSHISSRYFRSRSVLSDLSIDVV